jgi:hypothetical protein
LEVLQVLFLEHKPCKWMEVPDVVTTWILKIDHMMWFYILCRSGDNLRFTKCWILVIWAFFLCVLLCFVCCYVWFNESLMILFGCVLFMARSRRTSPAVPRFRRPYWSQRSALCYSSGCRPDGEIGEGRCEILGL